MALEPGQPDNYIEIETNNGTSQKLYRHFDRSDDIVDFIFKKSDYTNTIITVQVNGLPNNVTLYLVDENSNQLYSPVDINGNWVTTRCSVTVGKYSAIQLPAQFTSDLSSYTDFPAGMYNWKLKFLGDSNYLEKEIPLNVEIRDFEILEVLTPQIYPNEDVQVKLRTYGDTIYPYLISDWASESSRFYYDLSYILTANATYDNSTGIITYPNSDIDATIGGKNFVINKEKHFTINYEVISPIIACTGDTMGKDNKTSFLYDEKIYFGLRTDKERTGGFCDEASVSPEPTVPEITEPTIEDPDVELFAEKYSYDIEIGLQGVSITPGPMSDRQYYLPKNLYTNDSCPNFYSLPEGFISTENKLPPGTYYLEFNNIHTRFCKGSYNSKKQFTISTQNCELELIDENGFNLKSRYLYNGSTPIPNAKLGLVKDGSLIKTGTTDSNGEVSWNVDSSGNYFSLSFDYDDSYLLFSQNVDFTLTVVSDIVITSDKYILSYANSDTATLSAKPITSSGTIMAGIDVVFKKDDKILSTVKTNASGIATYEYYSTGNGPVTFTAESMSISKTCDIEDVYFYAEEEEYKYNIDFDYISWDTGESEFNLENYMGEEFPEHTCLEFNFNYIPGAITNGSRVSEPTVPPVDGDKTTQYWFGYILDLNPDFLSGIIFLFGWDYCFTSIVGEFLSETPVILNCSYEIDIIRNYGNNINPDLIPDGDTNIIWRVNNESYSIYETVGFSPTIIASLLETINLNYIKVEKYNDNIIFRDILTQENNTYWTVPSQVSAVSIYDHDGWKMISNDGYRQIKNEAIMSSEKVEVSFTYNGGDSPLGIANLIMVFYNETVNTNIGLLYSAKDKNIEIYKAGGVKISQELKVGDRIKYKYENGGVEVLVNDEVILTHTYSGRTLTGSHLEFHTSSNRWVKLKDFEIKLL